VLNTRPPRAALEFSRLLRERGFDAIEMPAFDVVPAWSKAEVRVIGERLAAQGYDWVVLPGANCAGYLLDALQASEEGQTALASTRIICGPGTAAFLGSRGIAPAHVLERFSAAKAAATLLTMRPAPRAVLAPRAEAGRPEVVDLLVQAGIEVDSPVMYRTEGSAHEPLADVVDLLRCRAIAAIPFASPSAVRGLVNSLHHAGEDPKHQL
jgi:uroporphyrinogen-III synthase